jgi:hypothetical protein
MWIMVAGPYRSGAKTEEERDLNLNRLNRAAYEIFLKGHTPVIGVNMALPFIRSAGMKTYDEVMMPISLALAERCDAILRLPGPPRSGVDAEVATLAGY